MILLQTTNLTIGYSARLPILTDLNLSVPNGKLICFMGPNGIGKSTLIRTLAGVQEPLSGKVTGAGSQNISVVLTDKINAGSLTVRDLVSYGRYPYLGWSVRMTLADQKIVDDVISEVRLTDLQHKSVGELSDGQMQMVMIARALAQNTPVLLLDEPTAHLDLNNRVEIMNLLRKLAHEQGKAILVATHELDLALQTADTIWLASREKNIRSGIPEDLVLDGTFDRVFEFKGFDLKTGRVQHKTFREAKIELHGEGHSKLWTKNALERNGFGIADSSSTKLTVDSGPTPKWTLTLQGKTYQCGSLSEILGKLIGY